VSLVEDLDGDDVLPGFRLCPSLSFSRFAEYCANHAATAPPTGPADLQVRSSSGDIRPVLRIA